MPLDPTEHLLYKATLPSLGDIVALLIHRNKHREAAKMRRQRNTAQMKEQNKTPEKELNKGDKQLTRCRVQTLVIRMLSELSEKTTTA